MRERIYTPFHTLGGGGVSHFYICDAHWNRFLKHKNHIDDHMGLHFTTQLYKTTYLLFRNAYFYKQYIFVQILIYINWSLSVLVKFVPYNYRNFSTWVSCNRIRLTYLNLSYGQNSILYLKDIQRELGADQTLECRAQKIFGCCNCTFITQLL